MNLGVVMPVVLQNDTILAVTLEAVRSLRSTATTALYVVCNRLSVCSPEVLRCLLTQNFPGAVNLIYTPNVERSVAGAWNEGCRHAVAGQSEFIAVVANDTRLEPDCLDTLVAYLDSGKADLCSGHSSSSQHTTPASDGADFSCFMFRPAALGRFGWFDPNFRPAYFEDNDYYARVVLGGGCCHIVHAAHFFHHGSLTIKTDAEMAYHVQYWFEKNRNYFTRKWGVSTPRNTAEGVLREYYHSPFNDATKPLSWFPDETSHD